MIRNILHKISYSNTIQADRFQALHSSHPAVYYKLHNVTSMTVSTIKHEKAAQKQPEHSKYSYATVVHLNIQLHFWNVIICKYDAHVLGY